MTITKIPQMIRYLKPITKSSFYKNIYFTFNSKVKIALLFLALALTMILSSAGNAQAGTAHYVRAGATGTNNGSDWNNAFTTLPATLVRGDTYYVADGNYASYTFDDPVSGTSVITIKKATASDHGTGTGWNVAYGDGQAVFADYIAFKTSYYLLDGNGTHTIPSSNSSNYGFKISSTAIANHSGVIRFGDYGYTVSNITVRYTHVYNAYSAKDGNYDTISIRFYPTNSQTYIKIQNSFLENSGCDGIQISASSYLLFERNYIKKLGLFYSPSGQPDYHGQTVQIFYGGSNIIFRHNIWEANEGQGLIAMGENAASTVENIRFYGNVVFNKYGSIKSGSNPETAGFNTGGGIVGDSWTEGTTRNVYVYNNTIVNVGGETKTYPNGITVNQSTAQFRMPANASNIYSYNNLCYKCTSTVYTGFDGYGYHASGGKEGMGGTSEQTGLASSIFQNYTGNDFRLASATEAGLTLATQLWWSGGADSFFGTVDSVVDMYGKIRGLDGTWDRGAYEYGMDQMQPPPNFRNILQ